MDATVRAKGIWGSGGAEASFFHDLEINEDNFYWLVNARYELSTESLDTREVVGFDLTERAKRILRDEGLRAFEQTCGTHFYSSRKLGAQLALLYEIHSRNNRVADNLKASADYSGFGWDASASFKRFVESARRDETITIHSMIRGGGASVAEYPADPDKMRDNLRELRTQLEEDRKGVVLEWGMQSYDVFAEYRHAIGRTNERIETDRARNAALREYYALYVANNGHVAALRQLLSQSQGSEPLLHFSAEKIAAIDATIAAFKKQDGLLQDRARACMDRASCSFKGLHSIVYTAPAPDADYRGISDWKIIAYPRENSEVYMDLMGMPPNGKRRRFFTGDHLLESGLGALVRITPTDDDSADDDFVVIGSFLQAIDPSTGKNRINLCVGDMAKSCNLRVVQHATARMDDGVRAAKLQLTIFDEMGFVKAQYDFLIQN